MLSLKSSSQTRWSANANATKALTLGYSEITKILFEMSNDMNEKANTRNEAKHILNQLRTREMAIMIVTWNCILQRINLTSKTIQSSTTNISIIVPLYNSLFDFIQNVRENFEIYENESYLIIEKQIDYKCKRNKKNVEERQQSSRQNFITDTHYIICDTLLAEIQKRREVYVNVEKRFGFLFKENLTRNEIMTKIKALILLYENELDIDAESFVDEFIQFQSLTSSTNNSTTITLTDQLEFIRNMKIAHTFPNVETCLHIFLTMPITNCTSERSFSFLKRIKNRLRSSMGQENLDALGILSIESDVTVSIDFDEIIDVFSKQKARKKSFQ